MPTAAASRSRDRGDGAAVHTNLYLVAVVGSLAVLAATGLQRMSAVPGDVRALLGLLDAGSENNVASWWGGMLFFLASLYALDCSFRGRDEASGAPAAWLAISSILLFFSADEVSSFHERMGAPGVAFGSALWLSAREILSVCLAAVAFVSLLRLWCAPAQRRAAVGLFLGFLILSSIYLQETLEHRIDWAERARTLRLLIEEGTELFGSLVILRVTMNHAFGESARNSDRTPATFSALGPLTPTTLFLGGLLCVVLAVVTAGLPDQHRGHPADWLAASIFLAAGLRITRPLFRGEDRRFRWRRDVAALICIVASMLTVTLPPLDLVRVGSSWLNVRLSTLAALAILLATTRYRDRFGPAVVIIGAATATGLVAAGWSLHLDAGLPVHPGHRARRIPERVVHGGVATARRRVSA